MAGVDATDLQDLAQALLDAAVEALDTIPYPLDGAPSRQFVSPGQPVDDCDQVAVYTAPVIEGPTVPLLMGAGTRHRQDFRVNQVGLSVRVTRCCLPQPSNTGQPPTADALTASAAQLNADLWALWNHVWNLARADLLFSLCQEVFFDSLTSFPPSGQCGGCVLSLRAQLEGYEEVLP